MKNSWLALTLCYLITTDAYVLGTINITPQIDTNMIVSSREYSSVPPLDMPLPRGKTREHSANHLRKRHDSSLDTVINRMSHDTNRRHLNLGRIVKKLDQTLDFDSELNRRTVALNRKQEKRNDCIGSIVQVVRYAENVGNMTYFQVMFNLRINCLGVQHAC